MNRRLTWCCRIIAGDPAFWTPGPDQVGLLQSAELIVLNGADAERWLELVFLDDSRLFDTTADLHDRLIPLVDAVTHQHGPEGEHTHDGVAHTTWLDPTLLASQAAALAVRLKAVVPGQEGRVNDNLAALDADLDELDRSLRAAFDALDEEPVLFSHPVYQYLERQYELNGASVHWEPGESPSTGDWIELQDILRAHRAALMIWEDDPMPSTREQLEASGVSVVTFRTAANRPTSGDFLSVMTDNLRRLSDAVTAAPPDGAP